MLGVLLLISSCGKRPEKIPDNVWAQYQAEAKAVCLRMSECLAETMNTDPASVKHDQCENQLFPLIGYSGSGIPPLKPVYYNPEHYESYSRCAAILLQTEDCAELRKAAATETDCSVLEFDSPS